MRFTITDFRKLYPNDSACLDKIFQLRYGNLEFCPECKNKANFRRVSTRRSYQCKYCYHQLYPTAGTVFEKTTTPLSYWFYAIYLMTATRNGVSAKEIERQLGVTYKTAFRMAHKIRELLNNKKSRQLSGFVEIDETYIGGVAKGWKEKYKNKSSVFGLVERGGEIKAFHIPVVVKKVLYPIIQEHVEKKSNISSDEYPLYNELKDMGYNHGVVKHKEKIYRKGSVSTNTIEGFFSQLKRTISGTHIHVSEDYLQNYVNECVFRYNNRKSTLPMFDVAINSLTTFLQEEKISENISQQKKETA